MLAPVIHALRNLGVPHFVIHTGQHYSPAMDSELFEDLDLPKPLYHLTGVAEKRTHAGQTGAMMVGCEEAFLERRPKLVLVNGDANTNLAAAIAARKLRIGLGHIEAGERSFDWRMPEEHNRRIMDHISELLFTTNEKGAEQLRKESVMGEIHVTGNTIVDASLNHGEIAKKRSDILGSLDLQPGEYMLMTSHREENVDSPELLKNIVEGAGEAGRRSGIPVVFPAHPRTVKRLSQFELDDLVARQSQVRVVEAMRYLDFLQLLMHSRVVLTDSGGVQQEAYIHERPCVTMRNNTEWTETLEDGSNRLSGATSSQVIADCVDEALALEPFSRKPYFGDGRAAERIAKISAGFGMDI